MPLVSILIPVYKVPEQYLRKCIESCINQTLKDIEIIIVDDGSPDNCGKICDLYAEEDERIRVIHKDNGGLAAARNTAFDVASGEYITFLDGDDNLELNACERGYQTAKKEQVQMVFWNQYIDYPKKMVKMQSFGPDSIRFTGEKCKDLQAKVLDFNSRIAQVFSKFIERKFLLEHNIRHVDELSQGAEGFVFNIQLFEYLESAYYLPEHLLHYTYNKKSISHSPNENNYYLIVRCFEYIERYIQGSKNKEELQRNLYNRMLYVVVTTAISGYFHPANKMKYSERKVRYKKFLNEPLIKKSMGKAEYSGLSKERKLILSCIKHDLYWPLQILGRLRRVFYKS